MKRRTAVLTAVIMISAGAAAVGAYYYAAFMLPQFTVPTRSPWTITKISNVTTTFTVENEWYYWKPNANNVFVVVEFGLRAGSQAKALDARDILVVVDGNQWVRPVGFRYYLDNCYVGTLSGTINPEQASLTVAYEATRMSGRTRTTEHGNFSLNLPLETLKFIYDLSSSYLDGNHDFQLKIAGSHPGSEFSVPPLPPPASPQGYPAISSSGECVAVTRNCSLFIFSGSNGVPSWIYTSDHPLGPPIISSDGGRILVVAENTLLMFDKSNNHALWTRDFIKIDSSVMSADGTKVVVASRDESDLIYIFYVVDASNGDIMGKLGETSHLLILDDLKISSNGRYVEVASGNMLYVFDCSTFSKVWSADWWLNPFGEFKSVAISSDGSYVAAMRTIDSFDNFTYAVQMYRKESGIPIWEYQSAPDTNFTKYSTSQYVLAFSADGTSLLAVYDNNVTMLFNAQTGTVTWTKSANDFQSQVSSISISSDGNLTVIASGDGMVHVLNKTGTILQSYSDAGGQAAISQDGKFIVASSRTSVRLLSGATLAMLWSYSAWFSPG